MKQTPRFTMGIGIQNFDKLRTENVFYIDKTDFIKQWWETKDDVTLITRPRRFGKTLNLSMLECFFSKKYESRADLFEGLSIWNYEEYRSLQGTYPTIFLSFASVKTGNIQGIKTSIKWILAREFNRHDYLKEKLSPAELSMFEAIKPEMGDETAINCINLLSEFMQKYYNKKVIILLDEYDTPIQEAWLDGNWDKAVKFFRGFFNAAFKTNDYMYRAIITGITRISKDSIFSDLNNIQVITTTSNKYAECFGFTENEVFTALDSAGLGNEKKDVKNWYNGFTFGNHTDIYNPWSIIKFIDENAKYKTYWADTSGNCLISSLIQKGSANVKQIIENLIKGKSFTTELDEQIIFNQLDSNEEAIWSLFLASGYLKVAKLEMLANGNYNYTLQLTNYEVLKMFKKMIKEWFLSEANTYNNFVKALLINDVDAMNEFMNKIALQSFSSFDIGKNSSSGDAPERFYHGFVLGLMVELEKRFVITSNKESGFGRYDIMLTPINKNKDNAYIIEFKVYKPQKEKKLEETVKNALTQIDEKQYETILIAEGIPHENIIKYGFAFKGKKCLIGSNTTL